LAFGSTGGEAAKHIASRVVKNLKIGSAPVLRLLINSYKNGFVLSLAPDLSPTSGSSIRRLDSHETNSATAKEENDPYR
jgi:hypothetical protein